MSNQLKRKMNYADNTFTEIAATWNNVYENVDDVKELVQLMPSSKFMLFLSDLVEAWYSQVLTWCLVSY